MKLWRWIRDFGPWSRAQKERELEREIQGHLSLEAEESGQHGAQRAFGNTCMVKEDVREAWGWAGVERFVQDARYGLRQVARRPVFQCLRSRGERSCRRTGSDRQGNLCRRGLALTLIGL